MPYLGKEPARVPVTAADIPDDSITAAKIVDGVITAADIGANAVGNSEMADDAVGVAELSATGTASNTTFLRGDNSWQTAGSTSASDLTSGTLPIARIADAAVTNAKMADDAIDSAQIADGSIDTVHLSNDIVSLAKMAHGTDGELITYDANGAPAFVATGSDGQVLTSTGAGSPPAFEAVPSNVTVATSAPGSPSAGDMWFDSTTGIAAMKVYNGTSWNQLKKDFPAYRYTRYYVVSSSAGHHPRISRIYIIQADGTKVQVQNSSASDNCSDSGDIPAIDDSYTHDAGAGNTKSFIGFGWYSVFTGGNRGSNIKLEGSSDNSSWTQIGTTTDAQSNSYCGEKDFYV